MTLNFCAIIENPLAFSPQDRSLPFQKATDTLSDGVRLDPAEPGQPIVAIDVDAVQEQLDVDAVQEQLMVVDIQVGRGAKPMDQRHRGPSATSYIQGSDQACAA